MRIQDLLRVHMEIAQPSSNTLQGEAIVLAAQTGDLCRNIYHIGSYPKLANAYRASARRSVGDIIVHCHLICSLLGIDFDEVEWEALIAFRDEMANIVKERKAEERGQ